MEPAIGIDGYLTATEGVGGTIKASPADFVVEELSAPPSPAIEGRYTIATLRVRNWETNHLVRQLARSLRISRERIGFAGTKDKKAVTTQLFSFRDSTPEEIGALRIKDVEVLDSFRSAKPLELGDLIGNRFHIVVRDLTVEPERAAALVDETARRIRACGGFPNFFGVQRFGSVRPITHLVGKAIVRGDFPEAVRLYVANPLEGEGEESFAVRAALAEDGDVKQALRTYPRGFTFEKAILNHLATHPDDHVGALRVLPQNLLMMFVHAYQSYLFNRMLSERMRRGIPLHEPVAGDLVLPANRQGLPDRERTIEVSCDNLDRVAQRCREGKAWVSAVLFGSESEFAGGEPGQIEKDVILGEPLRPTDFLIPDLPRISSKGSRREILAPVRSLDAVVEGRTLTIRTDLTRGAYATCLLREFMKSG